MNIFNDLSRNNSTKDTNNVSKQMSEELTKEVTNKIGFKRNNATVGKLDLKSSPTKTKK